MVVCFAHASWCSRSQACHHRRCRRARQGPSRGEGRAHQRLSVDDGGRQARASHSGRFGCSGRVGGAARRLLRHRARGCPKARHRIAAETKERPVKVVYDAGVLVAADKNERWAWAEQRVRLELGILPLVPSNVVAQASRSPRQVPLRRFLRGCEVRDFDEPRAHRVGALLGKARTADVVDASVVELAVDAGAEVVTTDPRDIARLVAASGSAVRVTSR